MESQDFKVTEAEGKKALPLGTVGFTQNDNGAAFLLVGTNEEGVSGERIYPGVPYRGLDAAVQHYIRAVGATCSFGIVTE